MKEGLSLTAYTYVDLGSSNGYRVKEDTIRLDAATATTSLGLGLWKEGNKPSTGTVDYVIYLNTDYPCNGMCDEMNMAIEIIRSLRKVGISQPIALNLFNRFSVEVEEGQELQPVALPVDDLKARLLASISGLADQCRREEF